MGDKRQSPAQFRHKGAAIAWFVIALSVLVVGTYLAISMLARYDYEQMLPEDAKLRVTLPEEGYVPATPTPTPVPVVTPRPLPTPMPTPNATPLPLDWLSSHDTRMVMPRDTSAKGEAGFTGMSTSDGDENQVMLVTGWAFLDGFDAQKANVYLVVSAKSGSISKFYEVDVLPGSTGIVHDASRGTNLERADFRAAFNVSTYEEGP
ncbi:MAG: hypothetical protein RSC06_16250, partial [Clostridia bacterium]